MILLLATLALATEPTLATQGDTTLSSKAAFLLRQEAKLYPDSSGRTLLCPTVGVTGKINLTVNADGTNDIVVSIAAPNDKGTFDEPNILKDFGADGSLDNKTDAESQVLFTESLKCYLLTH